MTTDPLCLIAQADAALAGADGAPDALTMVRLLRDALIAEQATTAAMEAKIKRLVRYLDTLDDGPQPTEVIDAICAIASGRTDHKLYRAALAQREAGG